MPSHIYVSFGRWKYIFDVTVIYYPVKIRKGFYYILINDFRCQLIVGIIADVCFGSVSFSIQKFFSSIIEPNDYVEAIDFIAAFQAGIYRADNCNFLVFYVFQKIFIYYFAISFLKDFKLTEI